MPASPFRGNFAVWHAFKWGGHHTHHLDLSPRSKDRRYLSGTKIIYRISDWTRPQGRHTFWGEGYYEKPAYFVAGKRGSGHAGNYMAWSKKEINRVFRQAWRSQLTGWRNYRGEEEYNGNYCAPVNTNDFRWPWGTVCRLNESD